MERCPRTDFVIGVAALHPRAGSSPDLVEVANEAWLGQPAGAHVNRRQHRDRDRRHQAGSPPGRGVVSEGGHYTPSRHVPGVLS